MFVVFGILYGAAIYFLLYFFEGNDKTRNAYLVIYLGSIAIGVLAGLFQRKRLKQFNIYTSLGVVLFFILIQISTAISDTVPSYEFRLAFFIYLGLAIAATVEVVLLAKLIDIIVPLKEEKEEKSVEDDYLLIET